MKKILVVLLVLLCVGAAFAEGNPGVSIGAWGRGLFSVGTAGGQDPTMQANASWGGNPRVGFTIASNGNANIGFAIDGNGDGDNFGVGDNSKIWAKLLDGMITLQVGKFYDDTFRGNASFGAHNWLRYGKAPINDGGIFGRVGEANSANFEVAVSSSGFYGFVAFTGIKGTSVVAADAFQFNGQYGAGYTIPDVGVIRAQYMGNGTSASDKSVIQGAFKLTAVKNLTVDIGVSYALDDAASGFTAEIPVFASYNFGMVTALLGGKFSVIDPDSAYEVHLGADVDLGNGLGLNADAFTKASLADNAQNYFGGMIGVTKGLGNGLIGVGVEISNQAMSGIKVAPVSRNPLCWAVPVRFEYSF